MKANTVKNLGFIELSEKVVVSDPCYDRDTWCMVTDLAVKPGRYKASVISSDEGEWGVRISLLMLVHEDHIDSQLSKWEPVKGSVGVDSGQCGIFDDTIFPQAKDHTDHEPFYDECCDITLKKNVGILKNNKGFVSSSGYGDGSYELSAISKDGERVALMLDYDLVKKRDIMRILVDEHQKSKGDGLK